MFAASCSVDLYNIPSLIDQYFLVILLKTCLLFVLILLDSVKMLSLAF